MKRKILDIVKHWMYLERERSSWIDPVSRKHTSIQFAQNKTMITTAGLVKTSVFPEVIFPIKDNSPETIIIPWMDESDDINLIYPELYAALVRLVTNSYDKTIIGLLKTLPREAWKNTTVGNIEFYSSPLDKQVLWVKYVDSPFQQYPFEVDMIDEVIAVKDIESKVSRAHVLYALKELMYVNKLTPRPTKKRRRRVAKPRT